MANLWRFLTDHAGVLWLLAIAFIVTMRDRLPSPFNRVPTFNWVYEWLHDALKTFVSIRGPKA